MLRPFQSLRHAIVLGVALCVLLPALLLGSFAVRDRYDAAYGERVTAPLKQYAELLVHELALPLWNVDAEAARQLADAILKNPDVVHIRVEDATLGRFVDREFPERRRGEAILQQRDIRRDGKLLGYVTIEFATGRVESELHAETAKLVVTILVQLTASFILIILLLESRLITPVAELRDAAQRLAKGQLDTPVTITGRDEIGGLAASLEEMRQELRTAFRELESERSMLRHELDERRRSESENRMLAMVAANTNNAVMVSDASGNIEWVNPAFEKITGYTLSEARGHTPGKLLQGPDTDMAVVAGIGECLRASRGCRDVELINYAKDGRKYWIAIDIEPILGADGKVERFIAIERDVTERKEAEAALNANHEFTSKIIESLPGIFYLIDQDGHFALWNKNFELVSGRDAEAMLRLHPLELFAGDDRALIAAAIDRVFEDGQAIVEASIIALNGVATPYLFTGMRVELGGGPQLVGVGIDVSERCQAEDALRASESKFSAAINGSLDFITLSRLDDGKFTLVNEAFTDLTGWSAAEAIGHTSLDLGIWFDPAERKELVARLRGGERVRNFPLKLGTRHGEIKECFMSAVVVNIDEVQHMVAVVRDVTEQREAERALQTSQNKMSALFHSSPVAMTVSRRSGDYEVIDANEAWERQFLLDRTQVIGSNGPRIGFWRDIGDRHAVLQAIEEKGELRGYEAWLGRGDGQSILCQISGKMIEIDGEQLLILAEEDITEKRRIERELSELNASLEKRVVDRTEALRVTNDELSNTVETLRRAQAELVRTEKMAALGSLVAGIAHELNTPIGNCITVASTLDEQIEEFVSSLQSGLRRSVLDNFTGSARLAADILLKNLRRASELVVSFKQVAIDQTSSQRREFALEEVVAEILLTLQPAIRRTPYVVDYAIPPEIVCDSYPGPLGQVIANLINNALLHGYDDRSEGRVSISARVLSDTHFELTVADDGCGIPHAYQSRIYDPFFTTKLGKGGSGLGLNIVYNLVTGVLGGEIAVDSEPGKGTRFLIVAPLVAPKRSDADEADDF